MKLRLAIALLLVAAPASARPKAQKPRARPDESAIREVTGGSPRTIGYVSARALEHYLRDRLEAGDGQLKLALLYDERSPHLHTTLADELAAAGRPDLARKETREALSSAPEHVPALLVEARLAAAEGRHGEAVGRVRRALDADPRNVEAWGALVSESVARGRTEEALAAADRLDALALEASDALASERARTASADALTLVAGAMAKAGTLQRVEELLRRAAHRDPTSAARLARLAEHVESQGRAREAADLLSRASYVAGGDPAYLSRSGALLARSGDLPAAAARIAPLRELATEPTAAEGLVHLSFALHDAGDDEHALEAARGALDVAPERSDTHYYEGLALEGLRRFEAAAAAFRQIQPTSALHVRALAHALAAESRNGRKDAAGQLAALAQESVEDPEVSLVHAVLCADRGDVMKARTICEGVVATAARRGDGVAESRARRLLQSLARQPGKP